jgi:hypothetical protein
MSLSSKSGYSLSCSGVFSLHVVLLELCAIAPIYLATGPWIAVIFENWTLLCKMLGKLE